VLSFPLIDSRGYARASAPVDSYHIARGGLLLATREGILLIGSGLVWSLSALILNYALYKSKLVPRWLSGWGLVGGVLSLTVYLSQVFSMPLTDWLFLPIALQEMVFAVWLIVQGFNPSSTASLSTKPEKNEVNCVKQQGARLFSLQ